LQAGLSVGVGVGSVNQCSRKSLTVQDVHLWFGGGGLAPELVSINHSHSIFYFACGWWPFTALEGVLFPAIVDVDVYRPF